MKKLILTVIVCALTICLLVVPVSAASGTVSSSELFTPWSFLSEQYYGQVSFLQDDGSSQMGVIWYYTTNTHGSYQFGNLLTQDQKKIPGVLGAYYIRFIVNIGGIENGDTYNFKSKVSLQYASSVDSGNHIYLQTRTESTDTPGTPGTAVGSIPLTVKASETDIIPGWTTFDLSASGVYDGADADYIVLVFQIVQLSGVGNVNAIGFNFSEDTTFAAGSGANSPIYNPPDDSVLNDYNSAEDSLLEDTNAGAEEMSNIFNKFGTTLSTFSEGIMAATAIFGVFAEIPEFYSLLFLSLALGILTFLFGVGQIGLSTAQEYARAHPYSPLMSPDGSRHKDYSVDEKWLL